MFLKRRFYYRPLVFILSVFFLMFAPLGSYVDARIGKFPSHAFAIALPAGIAAYEVVKYALIAIATSAGVYGITTADWDEIIWEFSHSYSQNTATLDAWGERMASSQNIYYDDGSMRNILIDYAMDDMSRVYFSELVEMITPSYDLSALPSLDFGDVETLDNTAIIMDRFYQYLLEQTEPVSTEQERMDEIIQMLQVMLEALKKKLDDAGAHVPTDEEISNDTENQPHKGKAQNDLNQAICDYFNYVVHAFEANSTFYQPSTGNNFNVHVGSEILAAWLSFLISKGLVSDSAESSSTVSVPVSYQAYDLKTFYGIENCVDISNFVFPDSSCKVYYGFPWNYSNKIAEPPSSYLNSFNGWASWLGDIDSRNNGYLTAYNFPVSIKYSDGKWKYTEPSKAIEKETTFYPPDGYEIIGTYQQTTSSVYTVASDYAVRFFSPDITFEKDGVTYGVSDFLDKHENTAYTDPARSVDNVPVLDTGGTVIYTPDITTAVPELMTKVDVSAQSPSTDLAQQPVQDLFDQVEHIYAPAVEPDVPVEPDFPLVPDVPVTPVDPGGSDTSGDPNLDGMQIPQSITDKFPFCVPFDLINCVKVWNVPSKAPVWEFPFVVESLGINEKITIDLTMFDSVTAVLRFLILLSYIVFLIVLTRQIIKG